MATTLAEINVIPLVDVMLVLLIIFMVTRRCCSAASKCASPQAECAQEISSERLFVDVPLSFGDDQQLSRRSRSGWRFSVNGCGSVWIRAPTRMCFCASRERSLCRT